MSLALVTEYNRNLIRQMIISSSSVTTLAGSSLGSSGSVALVADKDNHLMAILSTEPRNPTLVSSARHHLGIPALPRLVVRHDLRALLRHAFRQQVQLQHLFRASLLRLLQVCLLPSTPPTLQPSTGPTCSTSIFSLCRLLLLYRISHCGWILSMCFPRLFLNLRSSCCS
jgi:hypothetical protein